MPLRRTRLAVFLSAVLLGQAVAQAAENAPATAAASVADCPSGISVSGGGGPPPSDLSPPAISPTMAPEAMGAVLDKYLAELTAKGEFSGVVLVAKSGKALFERGYGYANLEAKAANTVETRFNIGSIGKLFTHVAVCQLIASGKLKPTDTIGNLLPDYPNAEARAATVAQLLNHTAGIANMFNPDFIAADKSKFQSNDDYYRFVAARPLTAAPGAKTEYCNGCFIVLGAVVARASGKPYETYIAENVFKPAGMTGAGFFAASDDIVAIGYGRPTPDAALTDVRDMHGARGSGAGGAYARARDLLAFDNALREFHLLKSPSPALVRVRPGAATASAGSRLAGMVQFGGGAPGVNAVLVSDGTWTIVVEANLSPPSAQRIAQAIKQQLMP